MLRLGLENEQLISILNSLPLFFTFCVEVYNLLSFPSDPFTILEPVSPSINVPELHRNRLTTISRLVKCLVWSLKPRIPTTVVSFTQFGISAAVLYAPSSACFYYSENLINRANTHPSQPLKLKKFLGG